MHGGMLEVFSYKLPGGIMKVKTPIKIQLENIGVIRRIICGGYHAVLLTESGKVYTFGDNSNNQLGTDEKILACDPTEPIIIKNLSDLNITNVIVGASHNFAITSDGAIFAWGNNDIGQLGLKGVIKTPTPFKFFGSTKVDIFCGYDITCALTDKGELFTWGLNFCGELGYYTENGVNDTPRKVIFTEKVKVVNVFIGYRTVCAKVTPY